MSTVIKEIREQSVESIKTTIIQLKSTLLEFRFKASQGALSTTHLIRETKRTIARLYTVLNERNEKLTNKDWKNFIELHKAEQIKVKEKDLKAKLLKADELSKAAKSIQEATVVDDVTKSEASMQVESEGVNIDNKTLSKVKKTAAKSAKSAKSSTKEGLQSSVDLPSPQEEVSLEKASKTKKTVKKAVASSETVKEKKAAKPKKTVSTDK